MKRETIDKVARMGFLAKGAIYLMIGIFAAMFAFGEGGQLSGGKGVIYSVGQMPAGSVLLVLLAIGLACYAVFRGLQAFTPARRENNGGKEVAKRVGQGFSAAIHAFLAFSCVQALGISSSGGGSKRTYLGQVLASDGGKFIVGALGLFVLAAACYQVYRAVANKVVDKLNTGEMSRDVRDWTIKLGRFGLAARGVVFFIIGYYLVKSAMASSASQFKGTAGALQEISSASYGTILLAVIAVGLAAYGAYMVVSAKYRRVAL